MANFFREVQNVFIINIIDVFIAYCKNVHIIFSPSSHVNRLIFIFKCSYKTIYDILIVNSQQFSRMNCLFCRHDYKQIILAIQYLRNSKILLHFYSHYNSIGIIKLQYIKFYNYG